MALAVLALVVFGAYDSYPNQHWLIFRCGLDSLLVKPVIVQLRWISVEAQLPVNVGAGVEATLAGAPRGVLSLRTPTCNPFVGSGFKHYSLFSGDIVRVTGSHILRPISHPRQGKKQRNQQLASVKRLLVTTQCQSLRFSENLM